jgi:hypothetical protein
MRPSNQPNNSQGTRRAPGFFVEPRRSGQNPNLILLSLFWRFGVLAVSPDLVESYRTFLGRVRRAPCALLVRDAEGFDGVTRGA